MAKVGTAHVEVKPVLNEEVWAKVRARIETEARESMQRGMNDAAAGRVALRDDLLDEEEE